MANIKKKTPGKKEPVSKILHIISTVVMGISAALLILEMFDIAKTYVGGVFLGVGFLIEAFSRKHKEKEGEHDPQNKPTIVFIIAGFIILAGLVYLYLDIK